MAELNGTPLNPRVVTQLQSRKAIVGKTDNRTSDELLFLNSSTGWIKLSSGVNTLTDEEVAQLNQQKGRTTIKGSNKLAKDNILQGGILNPNGELREGISYDSSTYNTNTSYNNRVTSTGIRPMPGITKMNVKSKNTFGTLREAEVSIVAWTLEDFEIIDRLYLRPGFTMLLEWGHSLYVDNKGTINKTNIRTLSENDFINGTSREATTKAIKALRESSDFNYEAMVGYVKNFSWNYLPSGGYECTVSIISTGEVLESIKMGTHPGNRNLPALSDFKGATKEALRDSIKSPYHYFMIGLESIGTVGDNSPTFNQDNAAFKYIKELATRLDPFFGFTQQVSIEGGGAFGLFDGVSRLHWLPLRVYFDIFNKFMSIVDTSKQTNTNDYKVVKINSKSYDSEGNYISSKFLTHMDQFSIDPTICVLMNQPRSYGNPNFGKVRAVHENLNRVQIPEGYDDVLNVLVSAQYLKGIIDSVLTEPYERQKGVLEVFQEVFTNINTALGGINHFDFTYDDEFEGGTYFVVDRNNTNKQPNIPELTLAGIDSIFTDVNISSKITNEIASQISIAAQGASQNTTENIDNILKWHPNVVDRLTPVRGMSDINKEGNQIVLNDFGKRLAQYNADVEDFFKGFNSEEDAYSDTQKEACKAMHAEATVYWMHFYRRKNRETIPGLVPVELSFKLNGIGGLVIGQTFKVAAGILPSKYQDKFGYIVTGLEHSIGTNNRWETSVSTQFYLIEVEEVMENVDLGISTLPGYGSLIPDINGTTQPNVFQKAQTAYEATKSYLVAVESTVPNASRGIKLLMAAQTQFEGYYPGTKSYRTNNPGNIGNFDNGKIRTMPNLESGVKLQYKHIESVAKGQDRNYPVGGRVKAPGGRLPLPDGRTYPPIDLIYTGRLDQYLKIYATGARIDNKYLDHIIRHFRKNGVTISGATTLQDIYNIK